MATNPLVTATQAWTGQHPTLDQLAAFLLSTGPRSSLIHLDCYQDRVVTTELGVQSNTADVLCSESQLSNLLELPEVSEGAVVIAKLLDPEALTRQPGLLDGLARLHSHGAVVVLAAQMVQDAPFQETLHELQSGAFTAGLETTASGLTSSICAENGRCVFSLHDPRIDLARPTSLESPNPLAVVATHNDEDIIRQVLLELLANDLDVHVLDNWSTDGTWSILSEIELLCGRRVVVDRFPASGDTGKHQWQAMLDRKSQIASQFPGRWIIHWDSDELRESPWHGFSLKRAFDIVQNSGWNAVDFTLLNFRPVSAGFAKDDDVKQFFEYCEFGDHAAAFVQTKAWIQPRQPVDLSSTGGHSVRFSGRSVCPYKFLLRHYPLRSPEQARRKIFKERIPRFTEYARQTLGWHIHYDRFTESDQFLWDRSQLMKFDQTFRKEHAIELITGLTCRPPQ